MLIKLSIVIGAFYFIYKKLADNEELDFHLFIQFLRENDTFSIKTIIFLVLLSVINWVLEILKWKTLVQTFQNISFKSAMEQSLGSLTASLFTPNRIGEYGAKAMYYKSIHHKKVVLLNLLGNVLQMGTTLIFGGVGLLFLNSSYELPIDYYSTFRFLVILVIVALLAFFGMKSKTFRIKGLSIQRIIDHIHSISKANIMVAACLSILRYLVFSFQFYVLLKIFGVNVGYLNAMMVISSMYLLASIVPSLFIFDVVIKGSVAVYLFSIVGVNDFTTLSIITLMWMLNFVIPSVFGSYYVLNFNVLKPDKD